MTANSRRRQLRSTGTSVLCDIRHQRPDRELNRVVPLQPRGLPDRLQRARHIDRQVRRSGAISSTWSPGSVHVNDLTFVRRSATGSTGLAGNSRTSVSTGSVGRRRQTCSRRAVAAQVAGHEQHGCMSSSRHRRWRRPGPTSIISALTGTAAYGNVSVECEFRPDGTAGSSISSCVPAGPEPAGARTRSRTAVDEPARRMRSGRTTGSTFVSTYPCTPTGDTTERDCASGSVELNTTGVSATVSPTLRQDFLIAENGKDNYMGGVGMAGNGTLHVVWTRSSATAGGFPSSYAAFHALVRRSQLDQPRRSCSRPGTGHLRRGTLGRLRGRGRGSTGPVCLVWHGQRIFGHGAEWKTWISRLQPVGTTYVSLTPDPAARHAAGGIGLSGKFTRQRRADLAGRPASAASPACPPARSRSPAT